MNFQMFKLVLEKAEEPEIKLPTSAGSSNKQESSRKTSIPALLTMPKFDCVDHNKLWKILQEMGIPDHLTCLFPGHVSGPVGCCGVRGTAVLCGVSSLCSPCLGQLCVRLSFPDARGRKETESIN